MLTNLHKQHSLERLVGLLKIYTVYNQNGPIKFIRLGKNNDGGYVVPELALQKSDVLIGYGIDKDISFEEQFSNRYKKASYGFDCGIKYIDIKNKLCHFISECIASNNFLYSYQKYNFPKKVSSFAKQLTTLHLMGKQIFIKMDIEGAEHYAIPQILKHAKNITGIVVEVHCYHDNQINKIVKLLSKMQQNFILIHVHGNNMSDTFTAKNSKGNIPRIIELTYINRSLVKQYKIAPNQKHPLAIDMPNDPFQEDIKFEVLLDKTFN